MEYNFASLCNDQLEKLEKRLNSLGKVFLKEYLVALEVINTKEALENEGQITQEVNDLFRDEIRKSSLLWLECMNKVQKTLGRHL